MRWRGVRCGDAVDWHNNEGGYGKSNVVTRQRVGDNRASLLALQGPEDHLLVGVGRKLSLLLVVNIWIAGYPEDSVIACVVVVNKERHRIGVSEFSGVPISNMSHYCIFLLTKNSF